MKVTREVVYLIPFVKDLCNIGGYGYLFLSCESQLPKHIVSL